ncbi:hypothetical protein BIW11_09574 [Tropilaelaps mercedesae]|uniref:Deltamethrin resistance protein prag01 domain-containing protein n=1 Tax=Tropilaelaps mercedesae TaxID=418985 RepID=A0A1V9XJN7_9ACAR|nr:hypothetical protein BIW11_09574 [Tropilaelaps mercedesae]
MHCFRNIARPAVALTRSAHHYVAPVKQPTYDALPKPSGNFKELYSQKQATHNIILAVGTIFGLGSIAAVYAMGLIDLVEPPKYGKNK